MGGIDKKYEKGDIEMISHIMAILPKEYSEVVTAMKTNGIANKSINDVRLAVRDMWERTVTVKTGQDREEECRTVT